MRFDGKVAFVTGGGAAWDASSVVRSRPKARRSRSPTSTSKAGARSRRSSRRRPRGARGRVQRRRRAVGRQRGRDVDRSLRRHRHPREQRRLAPHEVQPAVQRAPRSDLRELLEVNVVGVVNCSVACRASMQARGGGVIVNIASVSGHMSETPYGVSKLAVRGITVAPREGVRPRSHPRQRDLTGPHGAVRTHWPISRRSWSSTSSRTCSGSTSWACPTTSCAHCCSSAPTTHG